MSDEEYPSSYGLGMGQGVKALARTQVYQNKTKLGIYKQESSLIYSKGTLMMS